MLVVYTPARAPRRGAPRRCSRWSTPPIAETNTGYANSGVVQRLRLAAAVEVGYTEAATSASTSTASRPPGDGYIDTVHALRDTYKADMVSSSRDTPGSQYCGIAWLMGGNSPAFAPNAFSVVERTA